MPQKTTEKKPHTEETYPGKAATCTKTGLTDGKKCSVCGTVTVSRKTIPAKGHSYVKGKCSVCSAEQPNYVPAPEVTASNIASSGKIKLSWSKVTGAKSYKVYRATSKNGTYSLLTTVSGTSVNNTSSIIFTVSNKGSSTARFYSDGTFISRSSSYDRRIILVDKNSLATGQIEELDYVDIPAGESAMLIVNTVGGRTYYDPYGMICLKMLYDGIYYSTSSSYAFGFSCTPLNE